MKRLLGLFVVVNLAAFVGWIIWGPLFHGLISYVPAGAWAAMIKFWLAMLVCWIGGILAPIAVLILGAAIVVDIL